MSDTTIPTPGAAATPTPPPAAPGTLFFAIERWHEAQTASVLLPQDEIGRALSCRYWPTEQGRAMSTSPRRTVRVL